MYGVINLSVTGILLKIFRSYSVIKWRYPFNETIINSERNILYRIINLISNKILLIVILLLLTGILKLLVINKRLL